MTNLSAGETARLDALCNILGIRKLATEENQAAALVILNNLFSMPVIPNHDERRQYGIQILENANRYFPSIKGQFSSEFVGSVGRNVIEMQEFPQWYANINTSAENLADIYKQLETAVWWLKFVGIGAGANAARAGTAEFVKAQGEGKASTEAAKAGAAKALKRFGGSSDLAEAVAKRFGAKVPAGAGAIGVIVIAGASVALLHYQEEMEKIRTIIMHKYQSGQCSEDAFRKVFSGVDPKLIKKYWEM